MEQLKHECGVAMIRFRKPLSYYKEKYGTYCYGLNKLYLLMEKQHNRGQEGAGIGVVKINSTPGNEYIFRERALGTNAITDIFSTVMPQVDAAINAKAENAEAVDAEVPFVGEIYMGHLRYSTTGRSGISYVHPFLRRNNWKSRNLLLCGNFNMTNVESIFNSLVSIGQHPRIYSDTVMLLEQLGHLLDEENQRLYRQYHNELVDPELNEAIENGIDVKRILLEAAPQWDGGFVICGATGSGQMFALRDKNGIRPAFYYIDDEIVVLASERPVLQTVFNLTAEQVIELTPGSALIVDNHGNPSVVDVLGQGQNQRCSFERIYFSRGSDVDIYRERKQLGRELVGPVLEAINGDLNHTVFSFIPNTAEVAFLGMIEGLNDYLNNDKIKKIIKLSDTGELSKEKVSEILSQKVKCEKVAIKDIKLRTFIAEGATRNDLASHVYDVTYGSITPTVDTVVAIDDSIVRGTTLRQSIIGMLNRLQPKAIVIVSSSPQVRYPDCYGIDMSRMSEFVAFKAAIRLLRKRGMQHTIDTVYLQCKQQLTLPATEQKNAVKAVYAPFTDEEISNEIAEMMRPDGVDVDIKIVYQSIDGLHKSVVDCPGDWYFSGNYPTPGGVRLVNQAFVNFYEGHSDRRVD